VNTTEPPAPLADISVWNSFLEAYKVVIDRFEKTYADAGAACLVEHEVLAKLSRETEGKLRIQDLADLLLVSKSGASRIIDRMEEQDLVLREKSSIDRRVVYVMLTPRGIEALSLSRKAWRGAYQSFFKDVLDEAELEQLRSLMVRLTAGTLTGEKRAVLAGSSLS
jgi:DNA-binding MarR family transcriptional regulator